MSLISINQSVSATLQYNAHSHKSIPTRIIWQGREYNITKLGYHHTVRQGRTVVHIFSVANENTSFRLSLNSETLEWRLEEVFTE
jgi:hypothetical protein